MGNALVNATETMEEIDMSYNAGFKSFCAGAAGQGHRSLISFNPIMHVLEVLAEQNAKNT